MTGNPCLTDLLKDPLAPDRDGRIRVPQKPGLGIEIVSRVNGIPKGSRLAVSTSLLACLIAVCMRATGQAHALTGTLEEQERRLVAARAILGEWLGGSGGGWQDSGGIWPGMKYFEAWVNSLIRVFGKGLTPVTDMGAMSLPSFRLGRLKITLE